MLKKFGFTLAEVLITLGIIGVVAALTIPTLMQKTNDAELKSGFKKMMSVLNQAISMNYALDGVDFSNLSVDGTTGDTAGTSWLGFLYSRMNVTGTATGAATDGEFAGQTIVYFSDGSAVAAVDISECKNDVRENEKCKILVDVNGKKGPNAVGSQQANGEWKIGDRYYVYGYKRQVAPKSDETDIGNYVLKN